MLSPRRPATIHGELRLTPIPGGASRETWLVEDDERALGAAPRPAGRAVVRLARGRARRRRGGRARRRPGRRSRDRLEPAGGRFGTAGYLMDHVEGESVAPRVLRRDELAPARERLAAQLGEALARIHSIGRDELEASPRRDGDPALAACAFWERALDESASRCRRPRPGCAGCGSTPPPPPSAGARPRRLPARQLHRRRRRARGGDRLGARATSATRPRTSPGCASARGASATTSSPVAGLGRPRGAPRRLRARPAAPGPTPSGCAGGRRWETSSGR